MQGSRQQRAVQVLLGHAQEGVGERDGHEYARVKYLPGGVRRARGLRRSRRSRGTLANGRDAGVPGTRDRGGRPLRRAQYPLGEIARSFLLAMATVLALAAPASCTAPFSPSPPGRPVPGRTAIADPGVHGCDQTGRARSWMPGPAGWQRHRLLTLETEERGGGHEIRGCGGTRRRGGCRCLWRYAARASARQARTA